MIASEISNGRIEFQLYVGYPVVATFQGFSGQLNILLGTNVAQTKPAFSKSIMIDTHPHSPESIATQENSDHIILDQTVNGWIAYIKEEFYSVPEIESIYFAIDENSVDIWFVIPDRDFDLVRQLSDREMQIISKFASLERTEFLLEFHIVYRCGVDEGRFIPQRAIRLPR